MCQSWQGLNRLWSVNDDCVLSVISLLSYMCALQIYVYVSLHFIHMNTPCLLLLSL